MFIILVFSIFPRRHNGRTLQITNFVVIRRHGDRFISSVIEVNMAAGVDGEQVPRFPLQDGVTLEIATAINLQMRYV